jgi:hypothetical protein
MRNYKQAIQKVFSERKYIAVAATVAFLTLLSFYWAINSAASVEMFLKANTALYLAFFTTLSLINALLAGVAVAFIYYIFSQERDAGGLGSVQAFGSLLFSVGTTGCYACGTLLLPVVGLGSAFTSFPFAGLETKVASILLLGLSLNSFTPRVLGICKEEGGYIILVSGKPIRIKSSYLTTAKYLGAATLIIAVTVIAPLLLPRNETDAVLGSTDYSCEYVEVSR